MDKDEEYIISTVQSNRPLKIDENDNNEDEKEIKSNQSISEKEEPECDDDEDDDIFDEGKELLTNYIKYQNIIVETKEEEFEESWKLKIELF